MSASESSLELEAAVDEVFLGWWPDDLMGIVRQPYEPGAITAYAYRDGGAHLPEAESCATSMRGRRSRCPSARRARTRRG
ncbi:hypothetical protein TPA0906_66340 [Streptomyces olivaceus]|nr:hypothetical protein [Streptomyces olivaceus]GHJ04769.1 hypothetical protein TPA0906_66340 [Streptomyces olivaceus]